MGAVTRGLKGEEMAEIGLLQRAGAVAFTNGKSSIANARVMRNALLYAKDFGTLIVHHTEEPHLSSGAAMSSGEMATRLGLPRVHKAAEVMMVERDVRLVEITSGRYHAATISCADSLDVIRKAKARGLPVTCGISINHLTLNENDIGPYRTFFKVRPPLRAEDDRAAMVRGLASGDIDVVVSSHDPQDTDDKRRPFAEAADGAIGLETLLAAALRLFHNDEIGLMALLRAMTINPAKLLGLPGGRLEKGAPADLTLFDLNTPWVVDRDELKARSKNAPLDEQKVQGRVLRTMVAGKTVYQYGVEIRT
jgi:dihydroorotase